MTKKKKQITDKERIAYLRRQEMELFGLSCSVMEEDMERFERILEEVNMLSDITNRFEKLANLVNRGLLEEDEENSY